MIYVYRNLFVTISSITVLIIAVIIWEKILIHDEIHASKRRVKVNPEYPQLLKYMGYEHFAHRNPTK